MLKRCSAGFLVATLLLAATGACAEYGVEEEIVATVLANASRDVSTPSTQVVNVTLRMALEEVLFSQSGLERGRVICVIYTQRAFGDEPLEPPAYGKGERLHLYLRGSGRGRCYRPAFADGSFERLEE